MLAAIPGERVLSSPHNPISQAITLATFHQRLCVSCQATPAAPPHRQSAAAPPAPHPQKADQPAEAQSQSADATSDPATGSLGGTEAVSSLEVTADDTAELPVLVTRDIRNEESLRTQRSETGEAQDLESGEDVRGDGGATCSSAPNSTRSSRSPSKPLTFLGSMLFTR